MLRLVPGAISVLALALALPASAAALIADESNPATSSTSYVLSRENALAQTFTAGHDGRLVQLDVYAQTVGQVEPLSIQLRPVVNGLPGDRVLGEATLTAASGAAETTFPAPPAVRNGTRYALVFTTRAPIADGAWRIWARPGDVYERGDGFALFQGTTAWERQTPDFGFGTYLDVPDDVAAPTTTIAPAAPTPASGWWREPVGLTVAAEDGIRGSGVHATRCWIDPATPPATYTAGGSVPCPATLAGEGERTVYVASEDVFRNLEVPHALTVKIDTTPPETRLVAPADGPEVPVGPVTLDAQDEGGSGVAATYYEVGGDPAVPTTASPRYDAAAKPELREGERIRFLSVDVAGNVERATTSAVARTATPAEPPVRIVEVPGPVRVETRTVTVPGAPAGAGANAGGGAAAGGSGGAAAKPVATILSARARDLLGRGRGFGVTVGCGSAGCRATVAAEVRSGRKVVARIRPVTTTIAGGKAKRLTFTLTKAQRAKLGRSARVQVTVRTEGAGAAPTITLG